MAGYAHRDMYYMTGLPVWMRFGFSLGLAGRSSTGLTPAAQYLTDTGQLSHFTSYMGQTATGPMMPAGMPHFAHQFSKEQEVGMLKEHAKMLEQKLGGRSRNVLKRL